MVIDILEKLKTDSAFNFKDRGNYLQGGTCPQCSKKELFISKEKPYIVKCNRDNKCGYEMSTRDLYPDVFNNYTERYPKTKDNQHATAEAYLVKNRRFPLNQIRGWFEQGSYRLPRTTKYNDTVRFYIGEEKKCYWERLIDQTKESGQRINFGGKRKKIHPDDKDYDDYNNTLVKGEWWTPPGQVLKKNDTVYLVEGVFHAIALHLSGYKVAALLMAGNFPSLAMRPHIKLELTWRLALDDDKAGRKNMKSHKLKLEKLGQKVEVLLTSSSADWDDLYRLNKINDSFIEACLYRGRLFTAKSVNEKYYHYYCYKKIRNTILDYGNRFYAVSVDDSLEKALEEKGKTLDSPEGIDIFKSCIAVSTISNCLPEFLYCEIEKITHEISYFFKVSFATNTPPVQVAFDGSAIESPASFNKALLKRCAGGTFDGASRQLKTIRDRWFNEKILQVATVPFVGYDASSKAYLYQTFAYYQGKELELNEHKFFYAGKQPVKTSFKGFTVIKGERFSNDWFPDFLTVYGFNGLTALAFWFGSLFAEQIRSKFKSFPFLELTGQPGTGKTTLLEFLWKLVGRDDNEGFDPGKSTFAARARVFMQVSNLPVVLIESDREGPNAKQKSFDFEELKTAYNGRAIRSIGVFNRGNEVEEPPFRGTIVIAQNAQVDGTEALRSRIVHCYFTKSHFTAETKKIAPWFEKVKVEAVSGFLHECLKLEKDILSDILKHYDDIEPQYAQQGEIKEQRVLKTHAMVMAMAKAMKRLFQPYLTDDLLAEHQLFIYGRAVDRQKCLNSDHPIVQSFWESYDYLNRSSQPDPSFKYEKSIIEVETLNHSAKDEYIAINLKQFYQACVTHKLEAIPSDQLKKVLPGSLRHKYIATKNVKSKLEGRSLYCWVFKKEN